MNTQSIIFKSTLSALSCFALGVLAPLAQAVSPAPDGGYPNFTTAEGQNALLSLSTGVANTAVGSFALQSVTTGSFNTGLGAFALVLNTGDNNTATGAAALLLNTTGANNTANGTAALVHNSAGDDNTAVGAFALNSNTASENTAVGSSALSHNTTGSDNTAIGVAALVNITGSHNIALGSAAGAALTAGDNNIDIGSIGTAGAESNTIRIGTPGIQTATFIAGIRDVTTGKGNAIPVLIDSVGQLGTMSSSQRFKKEIKPMDQASEAILSLKPVTFQYKSDATNTPQFGLIAEEVAEVNPDLVVRDKNGEIYTVRYDAVNAMLLNEFLKEHRKVEEQDCRIQQHETTIALQRKDFEVTMAELKKEMETVVARLRDQDAKLQRVSDKVEMSKPGAQLVSIP